MEGPSLATQRRKPGASGGPAGAAAHLLGTSAAADELGVSASTLRRWRSEGRIEGRKVGKRWRFQRSDLEGMVNVPAEEPAAAVAPPSRAVVEHCDRQLDRLLKDRGLGRRRIEELAREVAAQADPTTGSDPAAAWLLARLLLVAVRSAASDLHLEPTGRCATVRQRIDGALAELIQIPGELYRPVLDELKRWTALDPNARRLPQDGRLLFRIDGREVDIHVSTLPTLHGEAAALRLLDRQTALVPIQRLGFEPRELERYQRILQRPNGLILLAGPTGCGTTTTIYSSLAMLNTPDRKIMTAEDPVECMLEGVMQTQVDETAGLGFARVARTMLRQASNVMFIGEVRDAEVAVLVVTAALTGHLVFSTVFTNGALAAPRRLIDLGVKPFVVASSLQCVVAQRLVRLLCPECKVPCAPGAETLDALALQGADRQRTFYRGRGCPKCGRLGYRGRAAVYELLELSGSVREALVGGTPGQLEEAARAAGWRPMREVALDKLFRGETTIEEVLRETILIERG